MGPRPPGEIGLASRHPARGSVANELQQPTLGRNVGPCPRCPPAAGSSVEHHHEGAAPGPGASAAGSGPTRRAAGPAPRQPEPGRVGLDRRDGRVRRCSCTCVGWGVLALVVAPQHYQVGASTGVRHRARRHRVHPRHAARLRRRPHRGHRQHHPQAHGRRQAPALGRLLVLPRPLLDRLRRCACCSSLGVRALAGQVEDDGSALQQTTGLIGTAVSGVFLMVIGILNLVVLRADPGRLPARCAAASTTRTTLDEHLNKRGFMNRFLGAGHQGRHQAVAHVPRRAAVRARLRHRDRGQPARPRRRRGRVRRCPGTRS